MFSLGLRFMQTAMAALPAARTRWTLSSHKLSILPVSLQRSRVITKSPPHSMPWLRFRGNKFSYLLSIRLAPTPEPCHLFKAQRHEWLFERMSCFRVSFLWRLTCLAFLHSPSAFRPSSGLMSTLEEATSFRLSGRKQTAVRK